MCDLTKTQDNQRDALSDSVLMTFLVADSIEMEGR